MVYDDDEKELMREVGKVSALALKLGCSMVGESVTYLEVAEAVEQFIFDQGMGLSFPMNISVGNIAAHYSPLPGEGTAFEYGDVVKVDCGAELDGYLGDNARTVEVGSHNWTDLINASREALDAALRLMRPGVDLREVGRAVESTIQAHGFEPIRNLTGHMLGRYNLHAGISIPNYPEPTSDKVEEGTAFAVEPFATNGVGWINGSGTSNIYRAFNLKKLPDPKLADIVKVVGESNELPFSARYVDRKIPGAHRSMRKLVSKRIVHSYPILREKGGGIVSQAEHSILITSDGCEILTVT